MCIIMKNTTQGIEMIHYVILFHRGILKVLFITVLYIFY